MAGNCAHVQGHTQNMSERELTALLGYNVMPGADTHTPHIILYPSCVMTGWNVDEQFSFRCAYAQCSA